MAASRLSQTGVFDAMVRWYEVLKNMQVFAF